MWFGCKVTTDAMEALKRGCGGSRDIFTKATHGEDEVNTSHVAEVKKAAIGRPI